MRAAPAVSRAIVIGKNAHEHTGSAEAIRPSLRNGFTAYFALSLATGFLATVTPEKRASQELDTSVGVSGPHDFAVRERLRSSFASSASTASHRAFVTCATPLSSGEMGRAGSADLPDALSEIFFGEGLDRFF